MTPEELAQRLDELERLVREASDSVKQLLRKLNGRLEALESAVFGRQSGELELTFQWGEGREYHRWLILREKKLLSSLTDVCDKLRDA